MKKIILAFVFAVAFLSLNINAQIYIPQLDPVHMYLQQQVFQQMAFSAMYKEMIVNGKKVRVRVAKPQAAPAKAEKSATAFSQAGGRILPERLGGAAGRNAAEIREAKQAFDALLDRYEKTALTDGFPANDLAYGFEFFIVNNYNIYSDSFELSPADKALMSPSGDPLLALQHSYSKKSGMVTSTDEKAVYRQVKTFLSANSAIVKLTDRQKQEFTEMLAIVTMMNFHNYETAGKNKDSEGFAKAQNAARQCLEKMLGVSADKIKISPNGLEF